MGFVQNLIGEKYGYSRRVYIDHIDSWMDHNAMTVCYSIKGRMWDRQWEKRHRRLDNTGHL